MYYPDNFLVQYSSISHIVAPLDTLYLPVTLLIAEAETRNYRSRYYLFRTRTRRDCKGCVGEITAHCEGNQESATCGLKR
jgi:hypothetical protein